MKRKYLVLILTFIFIRLFVLGQNITPDETNAAELRQKTFTQVWNIVNERHFDPTFGGVDWKKVGEIYQPKAMSAKSDEDFHAVLTQMLNELNLSHFNIITKTGETELSKCNHGVIGTEIRLLKNQLIISRVDPGSAAEKAGLQTGFEILRINNQPPAEIISSLETGLAQSKISESLKNTYRERVLTRALCGPPETEVKVEVLDKGDQIKILDIKRTAYTGQLIRVGEGLPSYKLLFEAKQLPDNIGYISFNVWVPQLAEKVQEAIRSMHRVKGIIFDLRGNSGGVGNLVNNVGGMMFSEKISFGKSKRRAAETEYWVVPRENPFPGKVVILTNCGTGSTSEIFTAGMKDTGRAKIIGERTAGGVLPSLIERLPTGANFLYAVGDYRSPNGTLIEGRGVEPDIPVELTRQSLLAGHDSQLEAAIKEISR